MSLGDFTYGSVAGVAVYVGYMPGSQERHFTEATVPSSATVESILDQVAAEINLLLADNGYQLDKAEDVLSAAPRAHDFLAQVNNLGAAARVLMTMPMDIDPDIDTRPSFSAMYKNQLTKFEGGGLETMGLIRPSNLSGNLRMANTGQFNSDGTTKKPLFWRGQFAPTGLREDDPRYNYD